MDAVLRAWRRGSLFWLVVAGWVGVSLPLFAETDVAVFQAALMEEKGGGDLAAAVERYEAVLGLYRKGRADARLAARSQQRLALLRRRLGLAHASEPALDAEVDSTVGGDLAVQRLLALREAFGIRDVPGRIAESRYRITPVYPEGTLARQIQVAVSDVKGEVPAGPRLDEKGNVLYRQIMALRKTLGIRGIPERFEALKKRRLEGYPWRPDEFYQAGLIEEKGRGDLGTAVVLYRQALEGDTLEGGFATQVRQRIARCRERLASGADDISQAP